MKKFWNGKKISEENLIELITECIENKWKNSDLLEETETACEIIALKEYEGKKEDIEYIIEKLDDGATLFDVEKAIQNGEWYFMETEAWRKRKMGGCKVHDTVEVLGRRFAILFDDETMTAYEAVWTENNGWETDFCYSSIGVVSIDVAELLNFDEVRDMGYVFVE